MKPTYQDYNRFLNIFYTAKSYNLGRAFCNVYSICDPELCFEKDDNVALDMILNRYIGQNIKKEDLLPLITSDKLCEHGSVSPLASTQMKG